MAGYQWLNLQRPSRMSTQMPERVHGFCTDLLGNVRLYTVPIDFKRPMLVSIIG